ncbi:MAG: hypothetical protein R6U88_04425 [Candidatus Bipolaricaulota bacterium]
MGIRLLERTLVLLFDESLVGQEMSREYLPEEMRDVVPRTGSDGELCLASLQAGIEVIVSGRRIAIRDARIDEPAVELVPKTALHLREKLDGEVKAYGLNYTAEFPVQGGGAGRFLATHLLDIESIEKVLSVESANVRLQHTEEKFRYRLSLEPRWQKPEETLCFARLNVHCDQKLPGHEELVEEFLGASRWLEERVTALFPKAHQ